MCDFPRASPPRLQLQQLRQLMFFSLKTKAYFVFGGGCGLAAVAAVGGDLGAAALTLVHVAPAGFAD
jgi:hypothetical protein